MRSFRFADALRHVALSVRPNTFFNDPPTGSEGNGTGQSSSGDGGSGDFQDGSGGSGSGGDSGRRYTQDEVNKILARDRHKDRTEKEKLAGQLRSLSEQGLTEENMRNLEATIETLQNEGKTKEQLAKEEREKAERRHQTELTKVKGEADHWKKQFQGFKIERDLLDASGTVEIDGEKKKARNPRQLLALLLPNTSLTEELDPTTKKPTGRYQTRVSIKEVKDGEEVTLSLSPTEAVMRLAASEEHSNLFESGLTGGLGNYNQSSSATSRKVPTNMDDYMKQRKPRTS